MCMSTVRVIRPVGEAPIKEFLKEYFRLIGCIYSDKPVHSREEAVRALKNQEETVEINLVLNISPQIIGMPEMTEADSDNGMVWCKKIGVQAGIKGKRDVVLFLRYQKPDSYNKDFYSTLLHQIVKNAWRNQQERKNLLEMADKFLDQDLFGHAQSKRSFQVSKMGEVLSISGLKEMPVPYTNEQNLTQKNYIRDMLKAFDGFYCYLNESNEDKSIYWKYARVNAARKVRELLNMMQMDWDKLDEADRKDFERMVGYCDLTSLLKDLEEIEGEQKNYIGALFLAARLCQSEAGQESNAIRYYSALLNLIQITRKANYAFVYYECGRFLEKQADRLGKQRLDAPEVACYQKAIQIDRMNYHAIFKLGCYYQKQGAVSQSRQCFSRVRNIILGEFYGDGQKGDAFVPVKAGWENVSLKGIQYLFKVEASECQTYAVQGFEPGARSCIENMTLYIKKYKENGCVKEIYGETSEQWQRVKAYHPYSWPVVLLNFVLDNRKKLARYTD